MPRISVSSAGRLSAWLPTGPRADPPSPRIHPCRSCVVSCPFLLRQLVAALAVNVIDAPAATAAQPSMTLRPAIPIRGESFGLTGKFSSRFQRLVKLQRKAGSSWVTVTQTTTTTTGAYRFPGRKVWAAPPSAPWRRRRCTSGSGTRRWRSPTKLVTPVGQTAQVSDTPPDRAARRHHLVRRQRQDRHDRAVHPGPRRPRDHAGTPERLIVGTGRHRRTERTGDCRAHRARTVPRPGRCLSRIRRPGQRRCAPQRRPAPEPTSGGLPTSVTTSTGPASARPGPNGGRTTTRQPGAAARRAHPRRWPSEAASLGSA